MGEVAVETGEDRLDAVALAGDGEQRLGQHGGGGDAGGAEAALAEAFGQPAGSNENASFVVPQATSAVATKPQAAAVSQDSCVAARRGSVGAVTSVGTPVMLSGAYRGRSERSREGLQHSCTAPA